MFKTLTKNGLALETSTLIGTSHAFTTRAGGVSEGVYESLNLGEHRGDERENVWENYRRLCEALGVSRMVFSRQVHGAEVRVVTGADVHALFADVPYEADGLVTGESGLALVIFMADCIPLLFHDPVRGVAAASHAGWRGTVADIAGETVRKMASVYGCAPADIRAAIGPGIGFCCFETGPEVPEAVRTALGAEAASFIRPADGEGKSLVDLKGVNRALLLRAGMKPEHIDVSEDCTMCLHEKYWSHRHTHGVRGSQAAVIALPVL